MFKVSKIGYTSKRLVMPLMRVGRTAERFTFTRISMHGRMIQRE